MIVTAHGKKYMVSREGLDTKLRNEKAHTTIKLAPKILNMNTGVIFPHWKAVAQYIKDHDLDCAIDIELEVVSLAGTIKISVGPVKKDQIFKGGWVVPAIPKVEKSSIVSIDDGLDSEGEQGEPWELLNMPAEAEDGIEHELDAIGVVSLNT